MSMPQSKRSCHRCICFAGSATEGQKGARGQLGGFLPNELGLLEKQVFLGGRGMSGDNDNSVAKGE